MWRLTNILVFVFLYLQCVNSDELFKQKTQYDYKGEVLLNNAASGELASIWTISGILSVEDLTDHVTFKLDNVKTRLFNGDPAVFKDLPEKDISEDAKIIQEPFLVYPGDKSGYNITHKPSEPIWSLNMKRSIASIFFLNTDRKTNSTENEKTIYGDCDVNYYMPDSDDIVFMKKIDHKTCKNSPNYHTSNVLWQPTQGFEPIEFIIRRFYHFDDGLEDLKKVKSMSMTIIQSMPSSRNKQYVAQSQEFTRISNTTTFEPTNIAELTKTSSILYDNSDDILDHDITKEVINMTAKETIDYYIKNYDEFKEYFESYPLVNIDTSYNFSEYNMYSALMKMDKDTLLKLEKKIFKRDDNLLHHIFVSFLPYLGTNESLEYIKNLVAQDETLNDLLTIKILATLPAYINDISEEIVQEMEGLMHLNKVANDQVKYAGILSFASIASTAFNKDALSSDKIGEYITIYLKNFEEAENYEEKMVWLLGLVNMGNGINTEYIFPLITSGEHSRHLRVLAAGGFKENLINDASPEILEKLWPIVKNNTEPFEVRVACLDIILYTKITKDQFKNIVNWYNNELLEPSEQHLSNYLYTSLKALQNITGYTEYMEDYATEILANIKPSKINKAWSTGNYRMAYTDSDANFGSSFQARLIANPITNVVNSAFLAVDSFSHSMNFGRYGVYIKAEGFADMIFSFFALNQNEEISVPKLLELIQKNAYRLKEAEDVHIDVVLLCNDRVVFSMHINQYNVDHYSQNPLFMELLSLIIDYNSLSYPVFDYHIFPSDLGTMLEISNDFTEIASYELKGLNQVFNDSSSSSEEDDLVEANLNYRSTNAYQHSTESYSPLTKATIGTTKFIKEEKRINIPYSFNFTSMFLQWKHEKDAFNAIGDHVIGTYVDDGDILHEYCEDCDDVTLINHFSWQNYTVRPNMPVQLFGVTFNITYTDIVEEQMTLNELDPERTGSLLDIMEHHRAMSFDNMAKPLLLLHHYVTYHKYIKNDLFSYSIRSMPFYNEEPSETIFQLDFNSNDNTYDDNPIAKDDLNVSFALTTRKQYDAEILSHGNLTFRYYSASESNSSDVQPHIHHKYDVEFGFYSLTSSPLKICIDRDTQYPNRRTNKFSLDPVDSTTAITTFKYGDVDNITVACPVTDQFYFTEVYTATEKQKIQMMSSNEYKNCKEQSKGLKFIPPTDDCFAAHEIISKYDRCDIYGDQNPYPQHDDVDEEEITTTEHGIHLLRYTRLNDTHSKVSIMMEGLIERIRPGAIRKAIETPDFLPLMTINPRVVAYDDDDLEWGFSSACYITPKRVRTFTGHTLKKYYEKSTSDSVAFVECTNTSARGMTIQKYGDKYVGFHLYSYNDSIIASVPNEDGKLKLQFNNAIITKENTTIDSEDYKIYFLDNDVIFISSDFMEIFYTGEYVSLEVLSIYNNYVCGLCSETEHY